MFAVLAMTGRHFISLGDLFTWGESLTGPRLFNRTGSVLHQVLVDVGLHVCNA